MKCANHWCIHEKDGQCGREEIELDIKGQCRCCQYHQWDEELEEGLESQAKAATHHMDKGETV